MIPWLSMTMRNQSLLLGKEFLPSGQPRIDEVDGEGNGGFISAVWHFERCFWRLACLIA